METRPAPIRSEDQIKEYLATDRFIKYVKNNKNTKKDPLQSFSREQFAALVREWGPKTLYEWKRYVVNNENKLEYIPERLNEDDFRILVTAMTKSEKGFIMDLYRYQEGLIQPLVDRTTDNEDDNDDDTTNDDLLDEDAKDAEGEELSRLTKELQALGETIPRGNELMMQQMTLLNQRIDELAASATARAGATSDATTLPIRANKVNLVKLDIQLPILKAARGENVGEWFFRIENWARARGVTPENFIDSFLPLIQGNAYSIVKYLIKNGKCSWSEFKKHIMNLYDPEVKQRELRNQLWDLKLRDNFPDFIHKFRSIINELEDFP